MFIGAIVRPCWEKLLRVCYQVGHQVTATPWKEFQLAATGARRGEFPSQAAAPGPEPGTATVSRAGPSHASFQVSWETRLFTLCRGRADRVMDWARSGGSGYWIALKTWIKCSYLCWQVTLASRLLSHWYQHKDFYTGHFKSFLYLTMQICLDIWTDEDSPIDFGNTCTF